VGVLDAPNLEPWKVLAMMGGTAFGVPWLAVGMIMACFVPKKVTPEGACRQVGSVYQSTQPLPEGLKQCTGH
jgi:hypothetical protein